MRASSCAKSTRCSCRASMRRKPCSRSSGRQAGFRLSNRSCGQATSLPWAHTGAPTGMMRATIFRTALHLARGRTDPDNAAADREAGRDAYNGRQQPEQRLAARQGRHGLASSRSCRTISTGCGTHFATGSEPAWDRQLARAARGTTPWPRSVWFWQPEQGVRRGNGDRRSRRSVRRPPRSLEAGMPLSGRSSELVPADSQHDHDQERRYQVRPRQE